MLNISKIFHAIVLVELCFSAAFKLSPNAWEHGNNFESDILLSVEQSHHVKAASKGEPSDVASVTKRWPSNVLVYSINADHFDETQIDQIRDAMREIETNTCVMFKPQEGDEHAVIIEGREAGCFSHVGYNDDSAQQRLNLGAACLTRGNIQHQLLHALGMFHTQSARDRDDHVTIKWENIRRGMQNNFGKYTDNARLGVTYDLDSLMHYSDTAFSKLGEKTIVAIKPDRIGQNEGVSIIDLQTINAMYEC